MGKTLNTGKLTNAIAQDSSNNIGIGGAASGSYKLQVSGTTNLTGALSGTSATFSSSVTANIITSTASGSSQLFLKSTGGGSNRDWQFQTSESAAGDLSIMQSTTAGGATYATKVNISPTGNVGIGTTSPTNPLHIVSNTISQLNVAALSGNTNAQINLEPTGTGVALIGPASAFPLTFRTDATERMRITSSGNVGIGTTGSNWATLKPIEIGNAGNFYAGFQGGSAIYMGTAAYYNSGWKYATTGNDANLIDIGSGNFIFQNAPSGTAGNNITWTERMRITSGGNVGIGTSSPDASDWNGSARLLHIYQNTTNGSVIKLESSNASGIVAAFNDAMGVGTLTNDPLLFYTNVTERMRITSGGAVEMRSGDSGGALTVYTNVSSTNYAFHVGGSGTINGVAIGASSAASMMRMNKDSGSTRSLNAAGTINANGADYAEYMYKATTDAISKGDICGVNANGELTNVYSDSVSFVVKSTNPSYVGNDIWATEDIIGKMPMEEDYEDKEQYQLDLVEFKAKIEVERAKVDRIAFSGQVPCNVLNAKVGDYIIPMELDGKISGKAVTNPTFEQYQISVGKVWKIMEDGRAWVAVKIG